tara:strand:- start:422 stop:841 length:420 start_codon:yes stop_codon:yes gene_type:complete
LWTVLNIVIGLFINKKGENMKKLTCHCGAVEGEINTLDKLEKVLRCNCSICKRKGAIMSMVKNEDFKIIRGKDKLKLYQFHSKVAKHYFCSNCGIYTHHNPRSNPAMTGFNVGCVDDIDIFKLENVVINDGQNHPLDKK